MDLESPATDYDVACEVVSQVGAIAVGRGWGLVLADQVPMSTWLPLVGGGGIDIVIPMEWGEAALSDEGVLAQMSQIPRDLFRNTGLQFDQVTDGATLLPACDSSRHRVYGGVEVHLAAGTYSVATAEYDDGHAWLRVHRLTSVT